MPDDDSHSPWANGDLPPGVSGTARPALKLEMNCTPMKHYDAFDVVLPREAMRFGRAVGRATSVETGTIRTGLRSSL
ncbi:hypothetical protein COOONC_26224 [Cooperia oncophora]